MILRFIFEKTYLNGKHGRCGRFGRKWNSPNVKPRIYNFRRIQDHGFHKNSDACESLRFNMRNNVVKVAEGG